MNDRRMESSSAEYEPPAVEQVLTPEELERQVHYAGEGTPLPV